MIAIATALEKCIKNCFGEEQGNYIEWIVRFFVSPPIIFAVFLEFQTREHLAENSKCDWSDGAFGYVSFSTFDTIVQFLNFYRILGGVALQVLRTHTVVDN